MLAHWMDCILAALLFAFISNGKTNLHVRNANEREIEFCMSDYYFFFFYLSMCVARVNLCDAHTIHNEIRKEILTTQR